MDVLLCNAPGAGFSQPRLSKSLVAQCRARCPGLTVQAAVAAILERGLACDDVVSSRTPPTAMVDAIRAAVADGLTQNQAHRDQLMLNQFRQFERIVRHQSQLLADTVLRVEARDAVQVDTLRRIAQILDHWAA